VVLVFMSRSSPWMREYTHGGEGRLFQLRQFAQATLQLKQMIFETYDHVKPYGI